MREKIRIAVCDDLPEERQFIIKEIKEYNNHYNYEIEIEEYDSGEAFLEADYQKYSLVFMDIFMGQLTGMQTVKKLFQEGKKMQIVFCSTSAEYAAEFYEVDAMNYLVKPVEKERFWRVLDIFFSKYSNLEMLTLKAGRNELSMYIADIIFVEAANKKCIIHTAQECVETSLSLKDMEALLPRGVFIRPIRYALVSLKHVVSIPTDRIKLSNGESISISRRERQNVKKSFEEYKWNEIFGRIGVQK